MNPASPAAGLDRQDRFRGALLGLAVGDALGTTLEFRPKGTFTPITDLIGGGPFHLEAGQWTDDTSMALCLAESLLACNGFDARDQMRRYCRWMREGYLSSTGRCFDIGNTVRAALHRFQSRPDGLEGDPYAGSTDPHTAGNGSLMRLAPVVLFSAGGDPAEAIRLAGESSRTTHGADAAVDACRYLAGLLLGALAGASKDTLLGPSYAPAGAEDIWRRTPLTPAIREVAGGSFATGGDDRIRGTGYVVASLEAALWAFAKAESFAEGALLAVNLGDDADTTGAIYGQIAGAYYGASAIPAGWLEKLHAREWITGVAGKLCEHAVGRSPAT